MTVCRSTALRIALLAAVVAGGSGASGVSRPPVDELGWGDDYAGYTADPYAHYATGGGRVGSGHQEGSATPTRMAMPAGTHFVQVSAGNLHSLGRTVDGRVFAWGLGRDGRLGDGADAHWSPVRVDVPPARSVSAGHDHSLVLAQDGTVWSWGGNGKGQLGTGDRTAAPRPVRVQLTQSVRDVEAGGLRSLAITETGRVLQWGDGRLSEHETSLQVLPVEVPLPADADVVQVDGDSGSLAVTRDGRLFAWGGICTPTPGFGDDCGQEPHAVPLPDGVHPVAASPGYVLSGDGRLFAMAWRSVEGNVWQQVGVPALRSYDAGDNHVLAITTAGRLMSWGDDRQGQLGLGTHAVSVPKPTYVPGMSGVLAASAGSGVSLALRARVPELQK